jgi:hypothetical protein
MKKCYFASCSNYGQFSDMESSEEDINSEWSENDTDVESSKEDIDRECSSLSEDGT